MKTTATNKKLRVILSAIQNKTLIPNPDFQRRLVWSSKHKNAFLRTVLEQYPFPEIYVAAGSVDPDTAEGTEMLVDGQQRITTLYQYFKGSEDLKLEKGIEPYSKLKEDEPRLLQFLEYEVVVRDLGQVSRDEIIEVFRRINSTKYSLNAVEVQNARFEGEFKAFSEWLSEHRFFEEHRVFTAKSAKRMGDLRFAMTLVIAMLSTYFNRDDELESYLEQYNDEFPHAESIGSRIEDVFRAVDGVNFGNASRAWNEVNLLTILVEVDRFLQLHGRELDAATSSRLHDFFEDLEKFGSQDPSTSHLGRYYAAQRYATADRSNRVRRGEILRDILEGIGPEVWRLPRAEHEQ